MWSHVARAYNATSDYIFPLDVDELLMTVSHGGVRRQFSDRTELSAGTRVEWSRTTLVEALSRLDRSGRPFKSYLASAIPVDCPGAGIAADARCPLRYASNFVQNCYSKVFARGAEWRFTDTGNHYGGTVATGPLTHSDCGEGRGGFGDDRIWKTYASSDLAVLHVQFVSIRGWLEHYIRGATTYNYTRRDVNCDTVGRGRHYCKVIREIRATGLDWNRLVLAYHRFGCPRPIRHHARLRVPLDVVQQKACVGAR